LRISPTRGRQAKGEEQHPNVVAGSKDFKIRGILYTLQLLDVPTLFEIKIKNTHTTYSNHTPEHKGE
jgi:hypothetical protein